MFHFRGKEWISPVLGTVFFVLLFACEVRTESPGKCDASSTMNCILSMGESAESDKIFFPDTQEKLRRYCKHLMRGLQCAEELIEKCATEEEKQLYRNLTVDMVGMNVALCTAGSNVSTRFLKHVNCYKHLSDRFKVCSDRYIGNIVVVQGLSKEEQFKMACCTVHEYSRCMKNVVSGRCEKDAADLVEETVIRTLSSPMHYCQQTNNIATRDCRKMFTPVSSHSNDNGLDYDGDDNAATTARISFTYLAVLLLRLMLYR